MSSASHLNHAPTTSSTPLNVNPAPLFSLHQVSQIEDDNLKRGKKQNQRENDITPAEELAGNDEAKVRKNDSGGASAPILILDLTDQEEDALLELSQDSAVSGGQFEALNMHIKSSSIKDDDL
jgi:hypothetical protein